MQIVGYDLRRSDGSGGWLVQGLLLAVDAASKLPAQNIALTLVMYLTLYAALLLAYVTVVLPRQQRGCKTRSAIGCS